MLLNNVENAMWKNGTQNSSLMPISKKKKYEYMHF